MKYLYIVVLMILAAGTASAQSRFGHTNGADEIMMSGHEYLQFDENSSKYFWAVDLNIFTEAQKSTFQDLVFNSETLVAVSTPDTHNYWYLASFKTTDTELVKKELNKLIEKARNLTIHSKDKYQ